MKLIDFEAHCYSPALLKRFSQRSQYPYYRPESHSLFLSNDFSISNEYGISHLCESCEERIAAMDKVGVTVQILSCSPGIECMEDPAQAIEATREVNDWMYSFTKKHPDRFRAFAALPIQDPVAACDELERCVRELGFLGWLTFSNYGGTYPDDDRYIPVFDKAGALGAAIYLHPTQPCGGRLTGLGPQLAAASFGFGIDTSVTLMRLILKGTFDRNPNLKLLLGHLGEVFPFILKRVAERGKNYNRTPAVNRELPDYYFKNNIWVTSSGQYSHESFRCTQEVLGIDRILLGTDYPYELPEEGELFRNELVLSQHDREKLLFRNAEALFNIKL
jgi:predicted TIM-barrel fold metal-dependent hydrolase